MEKNERSITSAKKISPPAGAPPHRHSVGVFIGGIALLCAILAIAELAFIEHDTNSKLNTIKNGIASLQDQAQLSRSAVQQINDTMVNLQTTFQQQQNTVGQLQQLVSGKQSSWIAAQLNYLVDLADYNLRYTRDVSSSIALLQTADQRLTTLNQSGYVNVRRLLAKSIAALQAVPKVDVAGILLRINTMQDQLGQLTLKLPGAPVEKTSATVVDESLPAWQRGLYASWHMIQKLIVVRRIDNVVAPLPSAEQQLFIQQNLQLMLQQTRLAVLRNQNDVYQKTLLQVKDLIQRYYDPNAQLTQTVMQTISSLQQINIAPPLPDLSKLIATVDKGDGVKPVDASSSTSASVADPTNLLDVGSLPKPKKSYRSARASDNSNYDNNGMGY